MAKLLLAISAAAGLLAGFEYQEGWPQWPAGGVRFSSPVLVDVSGDDTLDVLVAGRAHEVYLWNHRGELYPGWPRTVASSTYDETSTPAVGDINNDGSKEIVYSSAGGLLYAWRLDGSLVPGFPVDLGDNVFLLSPTLEDITGDGTLEIMVGTGNALSRFFVFRHDGSLMWSVDVDARVHSTAAVGDLNYDGNMEIVFGVDGMSGQNCIYAFHHDGTPVAGWPRVCGHHVDPAPALADVDNDGTLEVFVGSIDNLLYGLRWDGTDLPGWPNRCGSGSVYEGIVSSPAVGDINNDGVLNIVTGRGIIQSTHGAVFAFAASGETLPGFPVLFPTGTVVSSPVLADITDDGYLEIVVGCADGSLYALRHDGSPVPGFPLPVGSPVSSTPAIGDIDLDGNLEIAVGAEGGGLYIWSPGVPYHPDRAPWPMFHRDPQNTGRLPLGSIGTAEKPETAAGRPTAPATIVRGRLSLPRMTDDQLSMTMLDASGRKVMELQPGENDVRHLSPGVYFVREKGPRGQGVEGTSRKVVIQR